MSLDKSDYLLIAIIALVILAALEPSCSLSCSTHIEQKPAQVQDH